MTIDFGIEIDGEFISKKDIEKMSYNQVKMLVSFINNEKDLEKIKRYRSNDAEIMIYIDNLYTSINKLNKFK